MLLGLDLGTTNVKALLLGPDGAVHGRGSCAVKTYSVPGGGIEQDIDEIWTAALSAVEAAGQSAPLSDVEAVGVSSQGGAMQLLDGDGKPIGRVISWLDGRSATYNQKITEECGERWLMRHIGHGRCGLVVGQLARLGKEDRTLFIPPNQVGFVGDIIVGRLCGRRAHDATSLSIAELLNPELGEPDPETLARIGIRASQLPDLLSVREPAGALRQEVADELGLPARIPVSVAVHDQYAAALGCGAVRPGEVMFGAGTAWVLLTTVREGKLTRGPATPRAYFTPHVVEGAYGQMLSMGNGGSAIGWASNVLGMDGLSPEGIDDVMESAPPGCEGVQFVPLLATHRPAGLETDIDGMFTGLQLHHEGRHLLRAVGEGLVMELVRHLGIFLEAELPLDRLVACGGGAASRLIPRLLADTAGVGVSCVTEPDVSAVGAAVIALGLIETGADLPSLADRLSPDTRAYAPGKGRDFCSKLYEDYLALLRRTERARRMP